MFWASFFLLIASEPTLHIPLALLSEPPGVSATLNQDGSWTIIGDIEDLITVSDPGWQCLIAGLKSHIPVNNPTADNSPLRTQEELAAVLCADPIVRPCLPKILPQINCDAHLS